MSRVCDSRSATPTNPLIQYDSAVSADILFSRAEYCISRPLRSCPCFNTRLCVCRNPALTNLIFSCRSASQITPVFEYIYMCPLEFCSCQLGILLRVSPSDHPHICNMFMFPAKFFTHGPSIRFQIGHYNHYLVSI